MNFTVGNIVKRVYHIIREESKKLKINLAHKKQLGKGNYLIQFDNLLDIRPLKDRLIELIVYSSQK